MLAWWRGVPDRKTPMEECHEGKSARLDSASSLSARGKILMTSVALTSLPAMAVTPARLHSRHSGP
jgi:hypothetical protein